MHTVANDWLNEQQSRSRATPSKHRFAKGAFKLAVTVGILIYAVNDAARHGLQDHIRLISPLLGCIALAAFMIIPVFGGLRWWCVLRGMRKPAGSAVTLTMLFSVATVFGQALPTVASDSLRGWLAIKRGYDARATAHAIIFERGLMVLALLLVLVVTQPLLAARFGPFSADWIASLLLGIGVGGCVMLVAADQESLRRRRLFRPVAQLAADARCLFTSRWGLLTAVLGIISNAYFTVVAWLLASAIGLNLSWLDCLAVIPLVTLATTLPISFGGWGVREGVFVALLGILGVPAGGAFVLSVLFGVGGALSGLPGFVIWWLDPETVWPGRSA